MDAKQHAHSDTDCVWYRGLLRVHKQLLLQEYTDQPETKANRNGFFANYITKTYAEYYQSAINIRSFNERDRLELQFINTLYRGFHLTPGLQNLTGDNGCDAGTKRNSRPGWVRTPLPVKES